MLIIVVGTSAEVIKVAGIVYSLEDSAIPIEIWSTGQQAEDVNPTLRNLGLPSPQVNLSRKSRNLRGRIEVIPWLVQCGVGAIRNRHRASGHAQALLVQGDTMSTLIGALIARLYGIPVLHVEAGMRSGRWREPFPEEITRRLVSRLASVHFAPSDEQVRNLSKYPRVFSTFGNTAVDALSKVSTDSGSLPSEPYVLVSLHRQELISDRKRFLDTLDVLQEISQTCRLLMILDHQTEFRLREMGALDSLENSAIQLLPKQPYGLFIGLLTQAEAVITDSGGLQQECAELGIPCLVHRQVSETNDGVGENVILSEGEVGRLIEFVENSRGLRRPANHRVVSPSRVVAEYVEENFSRWRS